MSVKIGDTEVAGFGGDGSSVDIDDLTITKNSNDEIQAAAVVDQNTGIVKTWTGTQAEYDAIVTKDPDTEYIITDDIGGPATEIGQITEDINELKAHEVIAFQAPTAQNNYTWYRKYADGWVEQGGKFSNAGEVVFPVIMADNNFTAVATYIATSTVSNSIGCNLMSNGSGMYINSQSGYYGTWKVEGMAA